MIYLRVRGKIGELISQLSFAENMAKLSGQEIALYFNGSFENYFEYYNEKILNCGLFDKYQIAERYDGSIPVFFEGSERWIERVYERLNAGLDVAIEGDFNYCGVNTDACIPAMKDAFSPSQKVMDYINQTYNPTENSLYIDATIIDTTMRTDYVGALVRLKRLANEISGKTFDKVFFSSNVIGIFKTVGIEEILGIPSITYIEDDSEYSEALRVLFPVICGTCFVSGNLESWWGVKFGWNENKIVRLLVPYGRAGYTHEAEDGLTNSEFTRVQIETQKDIYEERTKFKNGQPSLYDKIHLNK